MLTQRSLTESIWSKKKKIQRRRERERAHRAAETAAEKEERLRKRRKRDQERRLGCRNTRTETNKTSEKALWAEQKFFIRN